MVIEYIYWDENFSIFVWLERKFSFQALNIEFSSPRTELYWMCTTSMKRWFSLRLGRVCCSRQCVWDGFLSIDCFDASVGQIDESVHGYTSSRIQGILLMRLLTSSSILGILLHTNCMRNGIEYTQTHTQPTHNAHVSPSLNQPSNYTCFRVPSPPEISNCRCYMGGMQIN